MTLISLNASCFYTLNYAVVLTSDYTIKPNDGRYQQASEDDLIVEMVHHRTMSYYRRYKVKDHEAILLFIGNTFDSIGIDDALMPETAKQYLLTGDLKWLNILPKS